MMPLLRYVSTYVGCLNLESPLFEFAWHPDMQKSSVRHNISTYYYLSVLSLIPRLRKSYVVPTASIDRTVCAAWRCVLSALGGCVTVRDMVHKQKASQHCL